MFFLNFYLQSQIWGFFNSSQIMLHQKESPGQNVRFGEKACTGILKMINNHLFWYETSVRLQLVTRE